ncbi:MAG TPA: DUF5818 domain-containing protein [Terriglobales bacterium]|jgi:hypothetical protein
MPQSDQGTSGSASSTSGTSSQSAASGTSYDGCIKEKGGKYILQTADGQKYQLSSTQDLSAHKGHEVRVTGETGTGASGSSSAASASSGANGGGGKNAQTLTVSNIEMVADNCKMKKNKDKSSSGMSSGNTDTTGAASNPSGTSNPK